MKFLASISALFVASATAEVVTLAHPSEALPAKETAVWSPLFQATWDQLNRELGGKPDKIESPNTLLNRLDSFEWKADTVMPAGSWKTWSGPATADFLKRANTEAAAMLHQDNGPFKLSEENPNNFAAFGLLDHEVTFEKEFLRARNEPLIFRAVEKETPVHFFGCRGDMSGELRYDVRVLAFRPIDRSHAIQISCKGADDSVILFLPPKALDFATACAWLRKWRAEANPAKSVFGAWNDALLHETDEVRIPYVNLDSKADLTSRLQGARFFGGKPWRIARAEQVTRFELHEKGARVHVEVSLEAFAFSSTERIRIIPRKFIYDRPFFVFLWRDKAEWPYFGAWIGDASTLKAFQ